MDAATEPRQRVGGDSAADQQAPVVPPPIAEPIEGAVKATFIERARGLRGTETAKALGLAVATMVANGLAVVFTIVFARILGTEGYGSLGALLNLSIILFVPGMAMQVAAAREGTLGRLGTGAELSATVSRWTRHLVILTCVIVALSVLFRHQIAAVVDVEEQWAAAAVPLTGMAWLLLSIQRGVLQSTRSYTAVGVSVVLESFGRLIAGVLFVLAGADVTGAYLGTPVSMMVAALILWFLLHRKLGEPAREAPPHPLRRLARDARYPIMGLTLVAALQNSDVIMAKHQLSDHDAGIYAAAAVAAKAVVWIAVGVGLYLLPEATRRAAAGLDPRTALGRALTIIGAISLPALLIFALVPALLLRLAFGPEFESGDAILFFLGVAFALLAVVYLGVQYLLGLGWRIFLVPLLVVAIAQPLLLLEAGDLKSFAYILLGIQVAAAAAMLAVCSVAKRPRAGTT